MADWNGYQDFLAIVRAGSISAAARQMGVSQPSLSRRLALFEARIGTRLLVRTPNALTLTAAGERALVTLDRVGDHLAQMEAEIQDADVSLRGVVRVSVTETLGIVWFAPLIVEFNEAYPHIQIDLSVDNAMVNLMEREAHIAVRLLRPSQNDLIAQKAGHLTTGLFAARSYASRYGLPQTPAEAPGFRAVGLLGRTPTAQMTADLFPPERHVTRSNSLMAVLGAVRRGLGIGPVLSFVGHSDPELVPCLPEVKLTKDIWLTAVPELRDTARIRAVYDFLAERLPSVEAGSQL